jgi:anti-anti-sigma factor
MSQLINPLPGEVILEEKPLDPILVVDDDALVLKALEITLQRDGYQILTAGNGTQAEEILKTQTISLIICDESMPDIHGMEVLKFAQEIQPQAIRIILTGKIDLETVIDSINIGRVDEFIAKPWEDLLLKKAVAKAVEKYRLQEQNTRLFKLTQEQNHQLSQIHAELKKELHLGSKIHQELLLGKVPATVPGLEIAASTIPSKEIDGDFYDFYRPSPQIFDIVLGDVMGKGLPAALVGTAVKTQFMRFAIPYQHVKVWDREGFWHEDQPSPTEILEHVQEEISKELIHLEFFVTLFYARFLNQQRQLKYVDCGSAKPLHFIRSKLTIQELQGPNFPLGMVERDAYKELTVNFFPGDLFIFYSDGITEAKNPKSELFGLERLKDIILRNIDLDAAELMHKIKREVVSFSEKDSLDDDVTLIIVKINEDYVSYTSPFVVGRFSSSLNELRLVRDFINRFCQALPGDQERFTSQVLLAINEAFCNVVNHSYKKAEGRPVLIQGELSSRGAIIQLSDQGETFFDPTTVSEPSLDGSKDGGFGWYMIKHIADQITYIRKENEDGWNHLRIYKNFIYQEEQMEIRHEKENNVMVITPEGESLDAKDAPDFKDKVIDLIYTNDSDNVVLNLTHLNFIDSSGLGSFLSILRLLHSRGGELKLSGMNKSIRTMFELVSMHKIFEIYDTSQDAIKSFQQEE